MSTGTFVILGVILAMTRWSLGSALGRLEWAKDTPQWVTTNTDFKKELKGRLVVVVVRKTNRITSSSPLSNTIEGVL